MCVPIVALGLATGLQTAVVGASLLGAGISAYSSIQQGKAAEAAARNNAQMAEYAAQDAQRRGEQEAAAVQNRAASLKSTQRVALASRGLDLTYGTAADLQDQTDFFAQSDAATVRTNAAREAWSARQQGAAQLAAGQNARSNATLSAAGTLLGTAGQVAGKWYDWNTPRKAV